MKIKYIKIFIISYTTFCVLLSEVFCLRTYPVTNCTCGQASSPSGRIASGEDAAPGEFPWQVAVYIKDTFTCGASLINNMYVLSAPHCFKMYFDEDGILDMSEVLRDTEVAFGTIDLRILSNIIELEEDKEIEIQNVVELIIHEGYELESGIHDICLLKLKYPLNEYTANIHPICLSSSTESLEGKKVTITGWGDLNEGGEWPDILQKREELTIIADDTCSSFFSSIEEFEESPVMCIELNITSICDGDSGGPVIIKNDMNKYEQIGVMSYILADYCDHRGPMVATRVSDYKSWIEIETTDATYPDCEN